MITYYSVYKCTDCIISSETPLNNHSSARWFFDSVAVAMARKSNAADLLYIKNLTNQLDQISRYSSNILTIIRYIKSINRNYFSVI